MSNLSHQVTNDRYHRNYIFQIKKKLESCYYSWASKLYTYSLFILTIELAKGTKMPKANKPRSGPPTMPNMLSAAYKNNKKSVTSHLKYQVKVFQSNLIRMRI